MSPSIEKKRVDWGTVKSMSGRINANLSSFSTSAPRMASASSGETTDGGAAEQRISLGDHSISALSEIDELEPLPNDDSDTSETSGGGGFGKSLTRGGDIKKPLTDTGHDTDKTQGMGVSSRTLDEFRNEGSSIGGGGEQAVAEEEDGGADMFNENDDGVDAPTPRRRRMYRRPSMQSVEDLYEDFYENIEPARVRCLRIREVCGRVVNNLHFQVFIISLIVLNSLMMGVGTFDFVTEDPKVSAAFEKIDLTFLIIFTVEIGLQLTFLGVKLFRDGWLVFDFVIVLISWSLSSLQIIRAFRIFRALRLITRVDTLRKLVTALMQVMPNMAAIGALLALVFYIFAVMFTVLFKDLYAEGLTEEDYFSSLTITLFTLTQMMTMDWSGVARECMAVYPWAWAPFILFVCVSGFIVFNLIIAVVCDAVATVEDDERELDDGFPDVSSGSEYGDGSEAGGSRMGEVERERVRELRSQVDVLVRNQVEMQSLIQRIVENMRGEPISSETPSEDGIGTEDELCISPAQSLDRNSPVWSEKSC